MKRFITLSILACMAFVYDISFAESNDYTGNYYNGAKNHDINKMQGNLTRNNSSISPTSNDAHGNNNHFAGQHQMVDSEYMEFIEDIYLNQY